jgi:hypothetical protein
MSEHTSDEFHNALARRLWKSKSLQPVCCSNYIVGRKFESYLGTQVVFELRSSVNSHASHLIIVTQQVMTRLLL